VEADAGILQKLSRRITEIEDPLRMLSSLLRSSLSVQSAIASQSFSSSGCRPLVSAEVARAAR
jgi:hypothetical protein